MYMHQLTFQSFNDKFAARLWMQEPRETGDQDECLTELKLKCSTNIALPVQHQKELVQAVRSTSYLVDEL